MVRSKATPATEGEMAGTLELSQKIMAEMEARLDKRFDRFESLLIELSTRLGALERQEAGCAPLVSARIKAVEDGLKTQNEALDEVDKAVQGHSQDIRVMQGTLKLVGWVGGIVGAAILGYILTGLLGLL